MARTGRPPKIQADDAEHLVAIVQSDRTATLDEIRQEFRRRTGIDVHEQTIIKTLGKLGIRRVSSDKAVVTTNNGKTLRLIFPQWEGGDNPPYFLGSKMLTWLAPEATGPVEEVPVDIPTDTPLTPENDMTGRASLKKYIQSAKEIVKRHQPDAIAVLGGDCLVSLVPFAWLSERYGDKLGVLWIDSHPDVQTPAQYKNAHAHVLGALMGNGDPDLTSAVKHPILAKNIMIAGIHDPLPYEAKFIADHGIRTCSPEEVRAGAESVIQWISDSGIEVLAIHLDLDVLDPQNFRSVLFARPGRGEHDFGDVAEGKLNIPDVVKLIGQVTSQKPAVGMSVAEHLPWDALALQDMLAKLPLISSAASGAQPR
ncbi:arginase family protein [Thauera butanivorans]|uniref:arginase family protein n=1 Tax=Thauera butanivorans TaxID=86174 RepID=UPI000A05FFEE|nr:arginase family protein [Thauera butanivorans]